MHCEHLETKGNENGVLMGNGMQSNPTPILLAMSRHPALRSPGAGWRLNKSYRLWTGEAVLLGSLPASASLKFMCADEARLSH